jgi:hypothetical protein
MRNMNTVEKNIIGANVMILSLAVALSYVTRTLVLTLDLLNIDINMTTGASHFLIGLANVTIVLIMIQITLATLANIVYNCLNAYNIWATR